MRKTKVAMIAFFIIVGISTIVQATNATVKLNGANEVKAEEEQTITIEVSNNKEIGVIEGVINKDSNIKDLKINSSYNGWTATYNETTGQFNAFKAEGTMSGGIVQITYRLNQNAQQGVIELKNVELTTIEYENVKIENNISKTIKKITETNNRNEPNETDTTTDTSTNRGEAQTTNRRYRKW